MIATIPGNNCWYAHCICSCPLKWKAEIILGRHISLTPRPWTTTIPKWTTKMNHLKREIPKRLFFLTICRLVLFERIMRLSMLNSRVWRWSYPREVDLASLPLINDFGRAAILEDGKNLEICLLDCSQLLWFSRDSIRMFNNRIKTQENKGLWTVKVISRGQHAQSWSTTNSLDPVWGSSSV